MHSDLFGFMEETTFKHWQEVNRETILDLARSRSSFAVMDEAERESHLDEVRAFYDDYGRGMDGMQIPYVTALLPRGRGRSRRADNFRRRTSRHRRDRS